jgi:N-acyl-D-amino-acid deacylase
MGFARRPPTADEQARLETLLAAALDEGAFGFSTGRIYAPSVYAETAELVALARVMRRHPGRLYTSHIRGEGPTLERAIAEAIEIGEQGGVPVQISHLKACLKANWPKMGRLSGCSTRRAGAGSTSPRTCIPTPRARRPWPASCRPGSTSAGRRRCSSGSPIRPPVGGSSTRAGWQRASGTGANGPVAWSDVLIAECPIVAGVEGRTLVQVAVARQVEPAQAMVDLLLEAEGRVSMIHFLMQDANVARGLQYPHVTVGSDNLGLCSGPEEAHLGKPHPRQHGCFAKILGTYVRERGTLTCAEAVHKMTGQSAARLGLSDRGLVRPGAAADLVAFAPDTVADRATYEDPHRYPSGIPWVWINGAAVLEEGRFHARPTGRVLAPAH